MKVRYPPTTREEHPLSVVVMHWVHVVSVAVLVTTGVYIHQPYHSGAMGTNRMIHFTFMWVFLCNAAVRVYWACLGGGRTAPLGSRRTARDCRWFTMPIKAHKIWETLKYYLFLRRTHPTVLKYNPLQAMTYVFYLFMIAFMGLTGLFMWTPTRFFFEPLTYFLGGLAVIHFLHYMGMWIFLVTIAVHIYAILLEVIREIPLMFWWQESAGKESRDEGR